MPALINEAWTAFGVRAQTAEIAEKAESVSEEKVVAPAEIENHETEPQSQPQQTAPQPQAANLTLF
jgi:hypothetical protein